MWASKTAAPPLKSGYFTAIISCSVNTVADRQRHAAYHNKQYSDKLFIAVNINDLEWPWISKIGVLMFFCNLWLRRRFQEWIASKWMELNQDNLRIKTAKAVARLMSFAQITCLLLTCQLNVSPGLPRWAHYGSVLRLAVRVVLWALVFEIACHFLYSSALLTRYNDT